jgi:hypothetical protein
VENLAVTDNTTGHAVSFSWTEPGDFDYARVEISYDALVPPVPIPVGTKTATLTGLNDKTAYTFVFTPFDTNGNAGTPYSYKINTPDKTPPIISVNTTESGYTNLTSLSFTLVLSESVNAFDQSFIVPVGATISSFQYNASANKVFLWLAASNPIGTLATVSWSIPDGSFHDAAGNYNEKLEWSIQCYNADIQSIRGMCPSSDPGFVYAIDYGSKSLLECDASKGIATARYPLAAGPIAIKRSGSVLFIALDSVASIARFDILTKSFLSSFSVPGSRYVHDIMVDEPRNRLFLLDYDSSLQFADRSSYAQFINLTTGALLSIATPKVVNGTTGLLSPDGSFGIFVAAWMNPMTLERYTITGDNIGTGYSSNGTVYSYYGPFAMSPDGSKLCCHYYSADAQIFNTDTTMALATTITGFRAVSGACYSPGGEMLYLTSYSISSTNAGKLSVVRLSDLSTISSVDLKAADSDVLYTCLTSDAKYVAAFASKSTNNHFVFADLTK